MVANKLYKYLDAKGGMMMLYHSNLQFTNATRLNDPFISIKIDKALAKVEDSNPSLKGALPSNYYAGLSLDRTKLSELQSLLLAKMGNLKQ